MIHYSTGDGVGVIELEGTSRHNILSGTDLEEMGRVWREADEDDAVDVIIVKGRGGCFSAGADVGSIGTDLTGGDRPSRHAFDYSLKWIDIWTPSIAVVEDHALGAGLEIALAADIRLGETGASFGLPEVCWGAIPAGGAMTRLYGQVPSGWATRLLLTGEKVDAATAEAIGLVSGVYERDELMSKALDLASVLRGNSPSAVRAVKQHASFVNRANLADGFAIEELLAARVARSADAAIGSRAFQRRETPVYGGEEDPT